VTPRKSFTAKNSLGRGENVGVSREKGGRAVGRKTDGALRRKGTKIQEGKRRYIFLKPDNKTGHFLTKELKAVRKKQTPQN